MVKSDRNQNLHLENKESKCWILLRLYGKDDSSKDLRLTTTDAGSVIIFSLVLCTLFNFGKHASAKCYAGVTALVLTCQLLTPTCVGQTSSCSSHSGSTSERAEQGEAGKQDKLLSVIKNGTSGRVHLRAVYMTWW